jgi:hypothetical protein
MVIVVDPVLGIEFGENTSVPRTPVVVRVALAAGWLDPPMFPEGMVLTNEPSSEAVTEKLKVHDVPPFDVADAAGRLAPERVAYPEVTSTAPP